MGFLQIGWLSFLSSPKSSWRARLVFWGLCLGLLVSCANKSLVRLEKLSKPAAEGHFQEATLAVQEGQDDLYGSNSEFLYAFDLGVLFHYQGMWDSSLVYLSKAENILEELYARSVTNEALSVMTNDNLRPYRGRPFEELWMHQIQILNYLAKGDQDGAVVQVRRAQLAMQALEQKDSEKMNDAPSLRYVSALAYEQQGAIDDALISYFKTLQGFEKTHTPFPPQAYEFAWHQLQKGGRSSDLSESQWAAPASLMQAEQLDELGSEIVVVGYAGQSPVLDELRFWGTYVRDGVLVFHYNDPETGKQITDAWPAPGLPSSELSKAERGQNTRSGTTLHINFAIPKLSPRASVTESFAIRLNSQFVGQTEPLAHVHAQLARNLEEEKTAVITRTVIRVALRTLAAQTAKNQIQTSNPLLNLLTNIGTDVLSDQLEEADLRVGLFLPKTLQMARIPVAPGTHDLTLDVLDAHGRKIGEQSFKEVSVRPGQKTFVFIPSLR